MFCTAHAGMCVRFGLRPLALLKARTLHVRIESLSSVLPVIKLSCKMATQSSASGPTAKSAIDFLTLLTNLKVLRAEGQATYAAALPLLAVVLVCLVT